MRLVWGERKRGEGALLAAQPQKPPGTRCLHSALETFSLMVIMIVALVRERDLGIQEAECVLTFGCEW